MSDDDVLYADDVVNAKRLTLTDRIKMAVEVKKAQRDAELESHHMELMFMARDYMRDCLDMTAAQIQEVEFKFIPRQPGNSYCVWEIDELGFRVYNQLQQTTISSQMGPDTKVTEEVPVIEAKKSATSQWKAVGSDLESLEFLL
jgi:hypothetical protein